MVVRDSLVLLLAAAAIAGAQSDSARLRLRGRVIDARTTLPIAGAAIVFTHGADTIARTSSDDAGSFVAILRDSSPLIAHFRWVGYRPDSIAASVRSGLPLRVALEPLQVATRLAPVRVAANARTGFERRAQRNSGGYFIRRADIEKRKPVKTAELFRFIPGVALTDSAGIMQIVSMRGYRRTQPIAATGVVGRNGRPGQVVGGDTISAPESAGERCAIRVGVDGRLQDPSFSVNDVSPEEIEGIETYMGVATIPIEFSTVQRNAICGLIMIWTRVGAGRRGDP
jgi:hypothetical protein